MQLVRNYNCPTVMGRALGNDGPRQWTMEGTLHAILFQSVTKLCKEEMEWHSYMGTGLLRIIEHRYTWHRELSRYHQDTKK